MDVCCNHIPASCMVCDRATCMTCRKLVTSPTEERKSAVRTCVECDPANEHALGRLDVAEARSSQVAKPTMCPTCGAAGPFAPCISPGGSIVANHRNRP